MNDNSVIFNGEKCIKCTRCVTKCNAIGINYLCMRGEGRDRYVDFLEENPCVKCGQCTLVCPVGAMVEKSNVEEVKSLLDDRNKMVIVQSAPSVRASIGELFKMDYNTNLERKLNSCYRKLGFDRVFDVNFGADITTLVEAEELEERLKNPSLPRPMFTSCCPSWVNFLQTRHPELLKNLTTALSPHVHASLTYKTWWAEQNNIDPQRIAVVSIMPCTSKKEEIYDYGDIRAVDRVLTVRELGRLIRDRNINFAELEESSADELGEYSGGGVIYGVGGGVMESALRVLKRKMEGVNLQSLDVQEVQKDSMLFRKAEISVGKFNVRIAIISGINNVKVFLDSGEYANYDYVEVMNCAGGCINGGGQPLLPPKPSALQEILEQRRTILRNLDVLQREKRNALDNGEVLKYLDWVKNKPDGHALLHKKI